MVIICMPTFFLFSVSYFSPFSKPVIPKVCSADHKWSTNPYTNQYFVLRGYFKWSTQQKSLESTALNHSIIFEMYFVGTTSVGIVSCSCSLWEGVNDLAANISCPWPQNYILLHRQSIDFKC